MTSPVRPDALTGRKVRRLALGLVLALAGAGAGAAPAALAQSGPFQLQQRFTAPEARDAARSGQVVPLSSVTAQLRQRFGGRLIDSQLVDGRNGPVYEIRWETAEGGLIDFVIDARTGAILRQRS
jgi:hypothetical protein